MAANHAGSNGAGHNPPNEPEAPPAPRFETAILAGSFVLLWVWFLARQHAYRTPPGNLPIYWHLLLLVPFIALVWVTIRRMRRVAQAIREESQRRRGASRR